MGAEVALNGHVLGNTTNQHLRYVFPIENVLSTGGDKNILTVTFDRDIANSGRFMACSGGWDWAPYSGTSQEGASTFSKGIVQYLTTTAYTPNPTLR